MVGLAFWLQIAVSGAIGVLALIWSGSASDDTWATISFLIFLAAIAYGFWLIKSGFDRIDRRRH